MKSFEVTDEEYTRLKELLAKPGSVEKPKLNNVKIFVLQRGWVVVGETKKVNTDFVLFPSAVIRIWGTKEGLPELVEGPTKLTKLDLCKKPLSFNELTTILSIDCDGGSWSKVL